MTTCQCYWPRTGSLAGAKSPTKAAAIIPAAKVTVTGPSKLVKSTTTAIDGSYSFVGLPPGDYSVQASAPELALAAPVKVAAHAGSQTLNLQLRVMSTTQQVTVQDNAAPSVSTDSANNVSALVLRGDDLQALSDDPDDLQADLQALAGPAAGPNGGSIFIDGFSGGLIPSKESIREIRINQNPFSPEYDKLGYGRIEIFTKPGTEKFHGTGYFNFGDSALNTRNPYAQQKAPFDLKEYGGNLTGPLNKKSSFFLDIRRDSVDNGAIINGTTLDPQTLAIVSPYTDVFRIPQRRVGVSPRVDYQLTPSNTLMMRYSFNRSDIQDYGIGGFNLVSRGVHNDTTGHTVQITDTAVIGGSVVNESRFQFFQAHNSQLENSVSPAIVVSGSFIGGGAQTGSALNTENDYEFQNYTSIAKGQHAWRFGARVRGSTVDNSSPQNFGGTFTFGGGLAPELDANNQPVLDASGQPVLVTIESIEQYRRTLLFQQLGLPFSQIRALGGGPTQFTINAYFAGHYRRPIRRLLSIRRGRLARAPESDVEPGPALCKLQTNVHDWRDVAPRVGMAWAPGKAGKGGRPKTVLRTGYGIFYDRFSLQNTLAAERYNGIVQQQYVVTNPNFFASIPTLSSLAGSQSAQAIQEVGSKLRAPYIMQSAAGIERQLPFNTTIAVTYANSHGLHILRSEDINAPLPGTYNPNVPGSGVFPRGASGPILLMESAGLYNQNQLITNGNSKVNKNISLFGSYMLNRAMSNTDGLGTYPSNPYNFSGEYGSASTDVRNRMTMGGTINTIGKVRLSPLIIVDSGLPFDITAGHDIYGDTLLNGS